MLDLRFPSFRLRPSNFAGVLQAVVLLSLALYASSARADMVTDWSRVTISMSAGRPVLNWRTAAIAHAAFHDALNAIDRRYEPYAADLKASGVSPEAAVASAGYHTLLALHADKRMELEAAYAMSLASIPDGEAKDKGVSLGKAVAEAILAKRSDDGGFGTDQRFPEGTDVGVWRPTPPRMTPGMTLAWARLRPFVLASPEAITTAGPPPLGSEAYLRDVAEVKRTGALDSAERTEDQTSAARLWGDVSSSRAWIVLAAELLDRQAEFDLWQRARGLALINFAITDAGIVSWDAKRRFLFWRPITAIREGGAGVSAEPNWTPLLVTPPHPDYLSGHAANCTAGAEVLQALLGRDEIRFTITSEGNGGQPAITRSYMSLSQAARECSEARVWGGIHFRTACADADRVGREIAHLALRSVLRPVRPL